MIYRLWPLMIGACALGLDAYVLAGILPDIALDLSTTQSVVGIGIALFTAVYAVTAPTLSFLSSMYRTRTILLFGLSIFILGNLITILSSSISLFLISRIVAGIGAGIYSPLAASSATGMVTDEQRGRALSLVLAGLSIGTAIGVPIGLVVAKLIGWRATIGIITLLAVTAIVGILRCSSDQFPKTNRMTWKDRLSSLRTPFTIATLGVTTLTAISSLGLYTYIAKIVESSGNSGYLNMFIWLWGIGGMVGSLYIGRFIDKKLNPHRATMIILFSLTISFLLIFEGSMVSICIGCFLWGISGWASITPQQHALITSSDKNHSTALIAWNSSLNYLGGAIGTLGIALLLEAHLPAHWMPIITSITCVAAIILHILKPKKSDN